MSSTWVYGTGRRRDMSHSWLPWTWPMPAALAKNSDRFMWKPWVTTIAEETSKIFFALTIVARVLNPAWSVKMTRPGTPARNRRNATTRRS